jgi:hypothetical protein
MGVWFRVSSLLVLSVLLLIYSAVMEYSTQGYLKGFSDVAAPAGVLPEDKISYILAWMGRVDLLDALVGAPIICSPHDLDWFGTVFSVLLSFGCVGT